MLDFAYGRPPRLRCYAAIGLLRHNGIFALALPQRGNRPSLAIKQIAQPLAQARD